MGLDARVYVSADRLSAAIDLSGVTIDPNTGEVTSESDEQFIALQKRLGNAAMIAWLSEQVADRLVSMPPSVLLTKVLYSGTHSGDVICDSDFPQLRREIAEVRHKAGPKPSVEVEQLLRDLEELIRTAQEQRNPIVFV